MAEPPNKRNVSYPESSQNGLLEIRDFPVGSAKSKYTSQFVNIDRRGPSNTVFHIDDQVFTTSMPRATHWSIAWSDLMMTMFVLFLSMFVYQTANEEFLRKKTPEIIGGDTTEALQAMDSSGATLPFPPIQHGAPLITAGTIKKVEKVPLGVEETPPPQKEIVEEDFSLVPPNQEEFEQRNEVETLTEAITQSPDKIALIIEPEEPLTPEPTTERPSQGLSEPEEVIEPRPLVLESEEIPVVPKDSFKEIYSLSKDALSENKLDKFAAIDLVPDKTMRIILTGDLLFETGAADLSRDAVSSLDKLAAVIRTTPYMINVVGHTDNIPMKSPQYKSNWELSVARASTVARFLIDEIGMAPNQFVVSGYSSYRPVVANNSAANRAKNRRVEIIISKRLPAPQPATPQNLN